MAWAAAAVVPLSHRPTRHCQGTCAQASWEGNYRVTQVLWMPTSDV